VDLRGSTVATLARSAGLQPFGQVVARPGPQGPTCKLLAGADGSFLGACHSKPVTTIESNHGQLHVVGHDSVELALENRLGFRLDIRMAGDQEP
jgi:hypothetical protein